MSVVPSRSRRREWADFVLLLLGMGLLGFAVWGGPVATQSPSEEIVYPQAVWVLYVVTGLLTVGGVVIAQRRRQLAIARGMILLAGLALLAGLLLFRDFGSRALLTMALPGGVLILLAWLAGPIPAHTE